MSEDTSSDLTHIDTNSKLAHTDINSEEDTKTILTTGIVIENHKKLLPKHLFSDAVALLEFFLNNLNLDIKLLTKYHRIGNKHIQLVGLEVPKELTKQKTVSSKMETTENTREVL